MITTTIETIPMPSADGGGKGNRRGGCRGRYDDGGRRLTEEEERLYARAREYVTKRGGGRRDDDDGDGNRRRRDDKGGGGRTRRGGRGDDDDDDDDERRRRRKSDHRRGKKSKHGHRYHRDDGRRGRSRHKKKGGGHGDPMTTREGEGSFRDKSSPVDSSKLVSMGSIINVAPSEPLDAETDYFSHNPHLRLYLYRKYGIYFEDLNSTEAHAAFDEFVISYNAGEVEEAYYTPRGSLLPQDALDQCSRTKHVWKFRTNRLEEQSLEMVSAGVKKQTEYNDSAAATANATTGSTCTVISTSRNGDREADDDSRPRPPPSRGTTFATADIAVGKGRSDRRHRERIELANEEIHGISSSRPGPGWERDRERKREISEKLHGAARDREGDAWGGVELDDDAIYGSAGVDGGGGRRWGWGGGGETSYEEAVAIERRRRERHEADKAARTSELMNKEAEKQKRMLEMLGLSGVKPGEKITIPPRNDAA
ncbi:hypothetical protein ACHAXA_008150 [Cyclostephanos tholiformis]|uniref:RNA-binding protein n=1 Tax=Cyclostephanos tholiformis TaxID=382380 RepID=A0ABD3SEN8_9STRA